MSDSCIEINDGRGLSWGGGPATLLEIPGRSGEVGLSGLAVFTVPRDGDEGVAAPVADGDELCPKNDANGLIRPNLPDVALSLSFSLSLFFISVANVDAGPLLGGGNGSDAVWCEISKVGREVDDDLNVGRREETADCRVAGSRTACMRLESEGNIDSTVKLLL